MKHAPEARRPHRGRQLPRPPRRGLIEAIPFGRGAPWGARLPRPPRRGLIEAARPDGTPPGPARNFPGHRAGASLKRTARVVPALRSPKLPRPPRRGLIEARMGSMRFSTWHQLPRPPRRGLIEALAQIWRARTAGANFPGHRAGASLKLPHLGGPGPGRRQLPRPPRRGLIEATWRSTGWRAASPKLPRPPRRGLIEAPRDCAAQPSPRRKLPRPPRRGLIEASSWDAAFCCPAVNFPGHRAGASLKLDHEPAPGAGLAVTSPATAPGPH